MSTLGKANNMHTAAPDVVGTMRGDPHCSYCDEPIKQVPGGQGTTWIHTDTGAVVGRHDPDALKARNLIRNILRDADKLVPELVKLMADNQLVLGDDADDERLRPWLEEVGPWLTDILDLRMLSKVQQHKRDLDEAAGYVEPVHPPRAENQRPTS